MRKQKFFKKIFTAAAALTLTAACTVSAFAATYIGYDGWRFQNSGTSSAVIYGTTDGRTEVVLPNKILGKTVIAVGEYAFIDCTEVTSVDFSQAKSLSTIGASAFTRCTSLTELTLTSSITKIGAFAFSGCTGLESVTFDAQITAVPSYCFFNCSALTQIALPETVSSIGEWAFADCTALEEIYIPSSVTVIDDNAFLRDDALTIYCTAGSYAQTYAEENSIDYVLTDAYLAGDVNLDGTVDIDDVTLIQKSLATVAELTPQQQYLAEVTSDAELTVDDATAVQKYIAAVIPSLGNAY